MHYRHLLLAALFGAAVNTSAAQERQRETMIDEHFSVREGGLLEVSASDADVSITSERSDDVRVRVVLEGNDMDRARDYYERQNFTVIREGTVVRVASDPERGNFKWPSWRQHPRILVEVVVPEVFDADVRSSDGDLSLDRLSGDVQLRTSDGDVTVGEVVGGQFEIQTSDGDVSVTSLDADIIEIKTSDGDLELGDLSAARISLRTSDGDIQAGALQGDAEVKTSDGGIAITSFAGEMLQVRTSEGSIGIDRLAAERCRAQASDGEIMISEADGDLEVSTSSGDIRLDLNKAGTIRARTSDGDVWVAVPSGHAADLNLRGEEVKVSHEHAFDGTMETRKAKGRINGGGKMIEARTSDGTVTIRVR